MYVVPSSSIVSRSSDTNASDSLQISIERVTLQCCVYLYLLHISLCMQYRDNGSLFYENFEVSNVSLVLLQLVGAEQTTTCILSLQLPNCKEIRKMRLNLGLIKTLFLFQSLERKKMSNGHMQRSMELDKFSQKTQSK